ncbi:MAG: ABC transporter permease [Planctomycetota bacterium]
MTFFLETFRLGLTNLLLHKLRSVLTALGIIIGVGAVVLLAAYGEGSKRAALADIKELGANNIILRSVKPPEVVTLEGESQGGGNSGGRGGWGGDEQVRVSVYGLTRLDYARLSAPSIRPVEEMVPLKRVGSLVYKSGTVVQAAQVFGTTESLQQTLPMTIRRGRFLTDRDEIEMSAVAVLGADVARQLFRLEDPLGNTFGIDGQEFTVVGLIEPVGLNAGTGRDINFDVYIPLSTAASRFGDLTLKPSGREADKIELSELIIRVPETSQVVDVAAQVRRVVEVGHGDKDDVQVIVPQELIQQEERTRLLFTVFMIFIASLSLLVGGIGIMNIMLASVTERIREIGIRRALGATRLHIMAQFLVETTVLSVLGGLIGVASGLLLSGVGAIAAEYYEAIKTPVPTMWSIVVGFSAAAFVGIFAGLYPAFKAAWQDPIVALRHD